MLFINEADSEAQPLSIYVTARSPRMAQTFFCYKTARLAAEAGTRYPQAKNNKKLPLDLIQIFVRMIGICVSS
jgi:hypothetical protein